MLLQHQLHSRSASSSIRSLCTSPLCKVAAAQTDIMTGKQEGAHNDTVLPQHPGVQTCYQGLACLGHYTILLRGGVPSVLLACQLYHKPENLIDALWLCSLPAQLPAQARRQEQQKRVSKALAQKGRAQDKDGSSSSGLELAIVPAKAEAPSSQQGKPHQTPALHITNHQRQHSNLTWCCQLCCQRSVANNASTSII